MSAPLASVRAYSGSGFNMNNIPISVDVLEANSTANDLEVINCLPVSGKTNVTITVKPFANLTKIDYIRITGSDGVAWYGIVNGYEYASMNTVYINATLDGWLTCQAAGINSITGYLTRHTTADDELFKYTEEDPLLIPSKALTYQGYDEMFGGGTLDQLIESTVDLYEMGDDNYNLSRTMDSDGEVVVPLAISSNTTTVSLTGVDLYSTGQLSTPFTGFYKPSTDINDRIKKGIAAARSLGYDNGILGSYSVPSNMYSAAATNGFVGTLSNVRQNEQCSLTYEYDQVMNKRLYAGKANAYILWSPASGEQVIVPPEDLYNTNNLATSPYITMVSDPRSKGRPYFCFGNGNNNALVGGLNRMVKGAQWANAPLNYQESSGQGIKERIFNAEQQDRIEDFNRGVSSDLLNLAKGIGGVAIGAATGNAMMVTAGGVGVGQSAVSLIGRELFERPNFERERAIEKAKFQSSVFKAPQIAAPIDADLMRDTLGNGVVVTKRRYSPFDLQRLDKVLNMFGYKDTKAFESSDLDVGNYCNYLECSDVLVDSQAPRFAEEIAAQQLSAGVRLWKVKPSSAKFLLPNR